MFTCFISSLLLVIAGAPDRIIYRLGLLSLESLMTKNLPKQVDMMDMAPARMKDSGMSECFLMM
jgi:hypothetical protein